ncbi:MAG: tRNA epoxyqueuosine(34) reductase QueG [bacterium]|nr:tRNA epoxyqueuosine(34) reductase QueG [bacterium]
MQGKIKEILGRLGFSSVGFVGAADLELGDWFASWLERGYQAGMGYMERNLELRRRPLAIQPGARSIICLAVPYKTAAPEGFTEPGRLISRYAWGRDYHEVIKKRLKPALALLAQEFEGFEGRVFVDSAPLPEKILAQKAGLGFIGKNSLLIHPEWGSYVFLAEIVCNLELESSGPVDSAGCGDCGLCLDFCPNSAIKPQGMVDANLCISYLTIEHQGPFSSTQAKATQGQLFGCDRCQDCCPYNAQVPDQPPDSPYAFAEKWRGLSFERVHSWTAAEFDQLKITSPLKRAGLEGLKRNAGG